MDKRFGRVQWGPQGKRVRTSEHYWSEPLRWNREAAAAGRRARVFCASLADVFEIKTDQPEIDEWREELFSLIDQTPHLDWLLLTKRPANAGGCLSPHWLKLSKTPRRRYYKLVLPPNLWIGTSVENQEQADKRIPELLKIPAAVRFLSIEPLLGPVDINPVIGIREIGGVDRYEHEYAGWTSGIDWVIVGGESGPNAKPMHPIWVRDLRDQCQKVGVPFFFKQWGEWVPFDKTEHEAWTWTRASEDVDRWSWLWVNGFEGAAYRKDLTTTMIKIGKKEAGRLLDGEEWSQFPEVGE